MKHTYVSTKEAVRQELRLEMEKFIEKGGTVEKLPDAPGAPGGLLGELRELLHALGGDES